MVVYEEALALARQIDHRAKSAMMLANLGWLLIEQADYERAEAYVREAVDLARQFGMHYSLPVYLMNLGYVRGHRGNYGEARQFLRQSIDLARSQNGRWDEAAALIYLGEVHLKFEQPILAREAFEESLDLNEGPQADPQLVAWAQYGLGRLAAVRRENREAYQLGQQSLTTFTQIGHYLTGQVQAWLETLPAPEEGYRGRIEDEKHTPRT